ncbi:hypothetical protein ACTXT7_001573 [Hymenolepis weldensis]
MSRTLVSCIMNPLWVNHLRRDMLGTGTSMKIEWQSCRKKRITILFQKFNNTRTVIRTNASTLPENRKHSLTNTNTDEEAVRNRVRRHLRKVHTEQPAMQIVEEELADTGLNSWLENNHRSLTAANLTILNGRKLLTKMDLSGAYPQFEVEPEL